MSVCFAVPTSELAHLKLADSKVKEYNGTYLVNCALPFGKIETSYDVDSTRIKIDANGYLKYSLSLTDSTDIAIATINAQFEAIVQETARNFGGAVAQARPSRKKELEPDMANDLK